MSKSKHINIICIAIIILMLIITVLFMFGKNLGITVVYSEEDENTTNVFTDNDLEANWNTDSATKIVLTGDSAEISGNGAYFSDNTLYIAYAGKYVISGNLEGTVKVDADGDDKIWIMLAGVDITSDKDAPIYISQVDKVFLTLKDGTENTLTYKTSDEESDCNGALFSRDDLAINGSGKLTVVSERYHGIVCNDSLAITGGTFDVTAKVDGIHAHDAMKIAGASITVYAGDDGLHVGNEEESSVFYMESGSVDITGCYEGVEANQINIVGGTMNIVSRDDGLNACGSGNNADINVSGGEITIVNQTGTDADGFDSNGNITISGGYVFVSVNGTGTNNAMDYGSENGGSFTISGGTIIACGSSAMIESPDSSSPQGFIETSVSGSAGSKISLSDEAGNIMISGEIPCAFTSILVSSPEIEVGDTVTLTIGESSTEITVDNTSSGSGFGGFGGGGGGFGGGGGGRQQGGMQPGGTNGVIDWNQGTTSTDSSSNNLTAWILIVVSVLILEAGLIVVIKKK